MLLEDFVEEPNAWETSQLPSRRRFVFIDRRQFLGLTSGTAAAALLPSSFGKSEERLPIIDVHLHAYPASMPIPAAMNPITGETVPLKNGAAHRAACLAEMKRLNIVKGVVSGGDGDRIAAAIQWEDA